jgi:hypothetical protein
MVESLELGLEIAEEVRIAALNCLKQLHPIPELQHATAVSDGSRWQ